MTRSTALAMQVRTLCRIAVSPRFAKPQATAAAWNSMGNTSEDPILDNRRKRIVYRAGQRGWLELDILLGRWAVKKVPHLDEGGLKQIEKILDAESPKLLKWMLGAENPPSELDGEVFEDIRRFVDDTNQA